MDQELESEFEDAPFTISLDEPLDTVFSHEPVYYSRPMLWRRKENIHPSIQSIYTIKTGVPNSIYLNEYKDALRIYII
jgi:hypothetical protein